jgi:aspartate racemase
MTGDFIPSRLAAKFNINTIVPDGKYIDQNHHYVSNELTQGVFSEEAKKFFLEQMRLLREKGAEGIILGCTELPMLIDENDFDLPLLATTTLHARIASDFILK